MAMYGNMDTRVQMATHTRSLSSGVVGWIILAFIIVAFFTCSVGTAHAVLLSGVPAPSHLNSSTQGSTGTTKPTTVTGASGTDGTTETDGATKADGTSQTTGAGGTTTGHSTGLLGGLLDMIAGTEGSSTMFAQTQIYDGVTYSVTGYDETQNTIIPGATIPAAGARSFLIYDDVLYWVTYDSESSCQMLNRSNLDGSDPVILATGLSCETIVSFVSGDRIYYKTSAGYCGIDLATGTSVDTSVLLDCKIVGATADNIFYCSAADDKGVTKTLYRCDSDLTNVVKLRDLYINYVVVPLVEDNMIFILDEDSCQLFAYDLDGTSLWTAAIPCATSSSGNLFGIFCIYDGSVFLMGKTDGIIYQVDEKTGAVTRGVYTGKETPRGVSEIGIIMADDDNIYLDSVAEGKNGAPTCDHFYTISRTTGETLQDIV